MQCVYGVVSWIGRIVRFQLKQQALSTPDEANSFNEHGKSANAETAPDVEGIPAHREELRGAAPVHRRLPVSSPTHAVLLLVQHCSKLIKKHLAQTLLLLSVALLLSIAKLMQQLRKLS